MDKGKRGNIPLVKSNQHNRKKNPWKTLAVYYIFGILWILFSDQWLEMITGNYQTYVHLQSYKGIFYVTLTTIMLFFLIRLDYSKTIQLNTATSELYIQTKFVDEIYDNSNTAILVWNEKNEIIKANNHFLELFEVDLTDVLGNKWYDFIRPENSIGDPVAQFKKIMNGETKGKFENAVQLKSGKKLHLLWSSSSMQFPDIGEDLVVAFGIDVTTEKKTKELLFEMAYTDTLTGLKNRPVFEMEIRKMIDDKMNFALFYLDIDDFKNLNDVYGHNYGDEFIKDYANRLRTILGNTNIYRWYGDKFLLVLHETSEGQIHAWTDKIMEVTKQCWRFEHVEYYPTVSIGVTCFPDDGDSLGEMMKNVDLALFRAKHNERTKVVMYERSFQAEIEERIFLENKISDALENDGFKLNFQPIYTLPQNKIFGMEVLLRLKNSAANVNIGDLIEVAEETGKILFIDFWVVEHVFQFISENMAGQPFMININLSAKTINSDKLLEFLTEMLNRYDVKAENIELEITEHSLIHNMNDTKKVINNIKSLGFKLSLDDFGTRYSSLNYLCTIPFDSLKIDKSYVDNILTERTEEAVVEQIIKLSKRLGLKTIAEGIESEEQRRIIADLGCDFAQGYLMARPMEMNKILELIHNQI